jgi:hypothetical protein
MRKLDWQLTLWTLLVLLLGVMPFFQSFRLLQRSGEPGSRGSVGCVHRGCSLAAQISAPTATP